MFSSNLLRSNELALRQHQIPLGLFLSQNMYSLLKRNQKTTPTLANFLFNVELNLIHTSVNYLDSLDR